MIHLQCEVRSNGDVVFRTEEGREFPFDSGTTLAEDLTELLEEEGIIFSR